MNDVMFVLEDMEQRMPTFERIALALNLKLFHVETVEEGQASFLKRDPLLVFFDHDLGGKTFVDSGKEKTGVHLARWVATHDERFKERLMIVHSMNPVGALDIVNELDKHPYYVNFGELYKKTGAVIKDLTKMLEDVRI